LVVWCRDAGSLGKPWQALTRLDELPPGRWLIKHCQGLPRLAKACQGFLHLDPKPPRSHTTKMAFHGSFPSVSSPALCYALVLPGRKLGFRAGFRANSNRECFKINPPAGPRPAGGPILRLQNPTQILPGSPISGPDALLCNIGYVDQPR
jgi:hypothetical protein